MEGFPEIERLENLRDAGRGALVVLLRAREPAVRRRTALALGRMADEATLPALREALADPDPTVRAEAAFAVALAGDEAGAPALLARAAGAETDEPALASVLEALGRVGGAAAVSRLAAAARDGTPRVREAALRGLVFAAGRKLGFDAAPTAALAAARRAPEPAIRFLAVYALGRATFSAGADAPALAALRAVLPDDHAEVTAARLKGLAAIVRRRPDSGAGRTPPGGPSSCEPDDAPGIERALDHADWRVRVEAARALPACGPDAADRLAAWVEKEAASARLGGAAGRGAAGARAAESPHPLPAALEALAPYAARPRVLQAAQRLSPRCEAVALLERAGQRAATLMCDSPPFRRKILHARVLGSLPAVERTLLPIPPAAGQTTAPPLDVPTRLAELALLARDPDPRVRAAAVEAVGEIDDPATAVLLREALRDSDVGILGAAAGAVRRNAEPPRSRPDPQATPALVAALAKLRSGAAAETMIAILAALGAGGDARAIPTARWAREDPNFSVRRTARDALTALGDDRAPPPRHPPPPSATPGDPEALRGRRMTAAVATSRGEIEIVLYPDEAPFTVASLAFLARRGFFTGLTFHRVVPGFVVQGGDPRGDGNGGPGYDLRCEYGRRRFARGSVGMALAGRDTGGSQFFITHMAAPHLDGRFTVIGDVTKGQEVVDAIVAGDVITSFNVTVREEQ